MAPLSQIGTDAAEGKIGKQNDPVDATDGRASPVVARFALIAVWLFLLSPMALQFVLGESARLDKFFLFNLLTTILWAATLHFCVRRPAVLHAWLLPLYVTTGIDLFLLYVFGSRLSSGYVNLGMTSVTSAGDFVTIYARPALVCSAVTVGIYILGVLGMRRLELRPVVKISAVCLALLAAIYGALAWRTMENRTPFRTAVLQVAGEEMSAPVGSIFQSGVALYLYAEEIDYIHARERHHFGAKPLRDNRGEIYVWVVGESSRAANWSLFGYGRNTTPHLLTTRGIISLPNVLATAPNTAVAVPSMLSPWPINNWQGVLSHRSVVSAFREAGFETYWLSNQRADGWSGAIPEFAAESAHVRYFDQAFDGVLLGGFRGILASERTDGKLFIVLHMNGSHFVYARRYPDTFARFHAGHPTYRDELVDGYDNSILYTDSLLNEIIAALAASHRPAALIYASDHGENLLDDKAGLLGHGIGTAYDLHPAALFWLSNAMCRNRPDMCRAAAAHAPARLSSSNLPHSLLDLAGIQIPQLDRSLSVFSAGFVERERWYVTRGNLRHETLRMAGR